MRTDPRAACANETERLGWALLHDGVCHPLMAITGYARFAVRFHDWTSRRAWPRVAQPEVVTHTLLLAHFGQVTLMELSPAIWSVEHRKLGHTFRVKARDIEDAIAQTVAHYTALRDDVGLKF